MRIAIVGAGAIGCLFGFRLHQSGQDVVLIHHKKSVVRILNKAGVSVKEQSGRVSIARIPARESLSRADDLDVIMLTVKAYQTLDAARSIQRWKTNPTNGVLSLQNGLGNIETLTRYLPATSILGGSTMEGALQMSPGKITHTGRGSTWIGELDRKSSERCLAIKRVFRTAGFSTDVSDDIHGVIWSKTIVNSAINPISALTGAKNGDLLTVPELRDVTQRVVEESYAVSLANGIRAKPSPALLMKKILKLASSNKSSMLQDIQAGRRTEIHQLNGHIARVGNRLRVPTPYNTLLIGLVTGLEAINARS